MSDATFGGVSEAKSLDFDTGGGVDQTEVEGLVFPASGGAVAVGGVLESGTNAVGALAVGGATPHDSVDSGNPVKIGAYAKATAPTNVSADGDRVNLWASQFGALNVILRDTSGAYASAAGSTQYAEDTGLGSTPTGTLTMARRDDALATLTPVEDDAIGVKVNSRGALWVSIADSTGAQVSTFGAAKPATSAASNVSASASNVTVLASNANRLGATIYNDSTSLVYLKLGATASSTSFTIKVAAGGYVEIPFGYTGIIDGIWVTAAGAARVVEFTA